MKVDIHYKFGTMNTRGEFVFAEEFDDVDLINEDETTIILVFKGVAPNIVYRSKSAIDSIQIKPNLKENQNAKGKNKV